MCVWSARIFLHKHLCLNQQAELRATFPPDQIFPLLLMWVSAASQVWVHKLMVRCAPVVGNILDVCGESVERNLWQCSQLLCEPVPFTVHSLNVHHFCPVLSVSPLLICSSPGLILYRESRLVWCFMEVLQVKKSVLFCLFFLRSLHGVMWELLRSKSAWQAIWVWVFAQRADLSAQLGSLIKAWVGWLTPSAGQSPECDLLSDGGNKTSVLGGWILANLKHLLQKNLNSLNMEVYMEWIWSEYMNMESNELQPRWQHLKI